MTEAQILRDALGKALRGVTVAKLGLAIDGVQHAKLVQIETAISAALATPAKRSGDAIATITEDAITFIEGLTAVPLLMSDDIEMRLEDVQSHARVEAASLRKRLADRASHPDQPEAPGVEDGTPPICDCWDGGDDELLRQGRLPIPSSDRIRQEAAEEQIRQDERAIRDVLSERRRQIASEGWTPKHDDGHVRGELSDAASCYALHAHDEGELLNGLPEHWPWPDSRWTRDTPRRMLVKASALIIAEIERLDRAPGHGGDR